MNVSIQDSYNQVCKLGAVISGSVKRERLQKLPVRATQSHDKISLTIIEQKSYRRCLILVFGRRREGARSSLSVYTNLGNAPTHPFPPFTPLPLPKTRLNSRTFDPCTVRHVLKSTC